MNAKTPPEYPLPLDEYHGQGGSYIVDPKTGRRRRAEPATADAVGPALAPPATVAAPESAPEPNPEE
jgi:hypothetical protein